MDKHESTTNETDFQTTLESCHSDTIRLLKSGRVHICQSKLLLCRARAASIGHDQSECLNRLLQALDRMDSSLEWLTNRATTAGVTPAVSAIDTDVVSAEVLQ